MSPVRAALVLVALAVPPLAAPAVQLDSGAPIERGLALGLFSSDPSFDYRPLVNEIAATGATHVSLCWVWWQKNLGANELAPVPGWTASREQVVATARAARTLGLHVTILPIVRLVHADRGEWRGRIAPASEDDWWDSYRSYLLLAARLAEEGGAQRLAIGSELVSRESMRGRWIELIDAVRLEAPRLELLYSANWDHFREVSFWDAVDVVGLTAYFEVGKARGQGTDPLVAAWAEVKQDLARFSRDLGRPLVITEVGYPSLKGATKWPWDQTRREVVDLEEQRRGYEAFIKAWSGTPFLRGVYFWNWFGFGGAGDGDYTPRHKPAQQVLERWYRSHGK